VGRQVPPPIAISPKLRMRPKPQLQIAIAPEPSARPEVPQPGGIFPKAQLQTDVPASPAMAPKPSAQPQVPPLIGMIPRTSSQAATPAPPQVPSPVQPSTRLEPIAQTHSLPPYPIAAKANGEQGATQMRVTISIQGGATDCEIIQTSGSVLLDQAACRHVLDHWRWKPPTRDGQPVTATSTVNVVWNLKSAR
jgi:protein TonB